MSAAPAPAGPPGRRGRPDRRRLARSLLAIVVPIAAVFVCQWVFWRALSPFAWFLFYAAVLCSSWLGGSWSGIGATALSAALVWFFFLPLEGASRLRPNYIVSSLTFLGMGLALSWLSGRLAKANRTTALALEESRRANENLRKVANERRVFAALVDNSSDFIGIADPTGKPVYVNAAGRRMVGLGPDDPVESTQMIEYYPEAQRAFASNVILKGMLEAGRWQGETCFRHWRTEESIPVSDTHFMVREPGTGAVLGMATITRDISDIKQARDRAEENQARFHALVSASSQIVWTTDAEGAVVEDSPSWRAFTGQTYEESQRRGWLDALHPDDRERVASEWRHGVETRTAVSTEFRLRHVSGEWRWTWVRALPITRPDGSVKEWVGMNADITSRKRAEDEQRFLSDVGSVLASTIDYEETLAGVASLVIRDMADCCIIDLVEEGGRVRRVTAMHRDPAMAPVMGVLRNLELDLQRPHLGSAVFETRQPVVENDISTGYISSIAHDEEHERALRTLAIRSLMAVPLKAHGRMLGALLFLSRTPGRYPAHDILLATELATRAALAVHNALLYTAAKRATELRDTVLGIVAHDLRNPLTTIMMQASLLQMGRPEGDRRSKKPGESIRRAAVRMNRLILDLLDVTRIEAGQLPLERAAVAVDRVARDVAEAQEPLVNAAGLTLKLDVARELPAITADAHRLLQIFENLIGNAAKFTPPGGEVTLGARRANGEVLCWVGDTGPGIKAEYLPHLFDRFWQARRGEHRGAGLGLPIVKGIVEAHGGRVWVESTGGRGTTVYFTLPVAARAEESIPVLH